ncbi:GroES-like protein [Trametes gibbosa]|nr:GroES-like protein [Trametes gibbosa]
MRGTSVRSRGRIKSPRCSGPSPHPPAPTAPGCSSISEARYRQPPKKICKTRCRATMSAPGELKFMGYAMTDPSAWSDLRLVEFQPKTFGPEDVELAITHCGVCGSDVHVLTQSWSPVRAGPTVVGHEIVGTVTRVGAHVAAVRPGDRVGVGGALDSCGACRACADGHENYCPRRVIALMGAHRDGVPSQGGFATGIRANERFVFPIPAAVESRHAASMMCGGLTAFHPLRANGCGPGKKVGVIGVGGVGHYAILFAKAMGAEVVAFTRGSGKAEDARRLGADCVVDTTGKAFWEAHVFSLDIIISTVDHFGAETTLPDILSMLYVQGRYITIGLPAADDPLPGLHPFVMAQNGSSVGSSFLGSKGDAVAMLELAAEKKVVPWIEELPMSQAKVALEGVQAGKARYRYVLTQDIEQV